VAGDASPERTPVLRGEFDAGEVVARAAWPGGERPALPCPALPELQPGCTVVVCTYQRPALVRRFLDSLRGQDPRPERLLIVDASTDGATERMLREYGRWEELAARTMYYRVAGRLRGLTRQRNFALRQVDTQWTVFFDDDIVLLPGCLREMLAAAGGPGVLGVGALLGRKSVPSKIAALWRVRRALGMVSSLRPGSYCRSGMYVPWNFLPSDTEEVWEGQFLPGCAALWNTALARQIGYNETFRGYANAEDIEFSMRMQARGKVVLAGKAGLLHLHDGDGRPDPWQMGYLNLRNAYYIHRHCLERRTWKDGAWFFYAFGLDTLVRAVNLFRPRRTRDTWQYLQGRMHGFHELLRGT
jgi:GT2 family glycosyltransferase